MARRACQPDLFPNEDERLWVIMETIRDKAGLSVEQLALLEARLKVTPPVGKDDTAYLCAVWRGEWSKAFAGAKAPYLGQRESGVLTTLAKQAGGAHELAKMIAVFFAWRAEQQQAEERRRGDKPIYVPSPDPFALQQNFARMKARAAQAEAERKRQVVRKEADRAADADKKPCAPPTEFKALKHRLEGHLTDAQINDRRRELADQVEHVRARKNVPTQEARPS